MLPCACDCPKDAERRMLGDDVVSPVWYECVLFQRAHDRWPDALELMLSLLAAYAEKGMTWEEAAHWIARSLTEGIEPEDPPRVALVGDEYRATAPVR